MDITDYNVDGIFDEMVNHDGSIRKPYIELYDKIKDISITDLEVKQKAAENAFLRMGITFKVYSQEDQSDESIFPFDIIPRIISSTEWGIIERGLKQRVEALNLFINDVYNDKLVIKDKIIPEKIVYSSQGYLKECEGFQPYKNIWCHVSGIDLIKHNDGNYYILEDNLRVPSGVSYVLENRVVMKRTYPQLFDSLKVRHIIDYPNRLRDMLQFITGKNEGTSVVITPGIYNSAYFEHSFLAKQMGITLVEGRDLVCQGGYVYMKTTKGLIKVDSIYRRIDDTFMDPNVFVPTSVLGVPGIFDAYKRGNVAIANAIGTGIADDKVICAYVPKFIKYYLGEEPIIENVPTFLCSEKKERDYVLKNLNKMVVKAASQSGGYGMLMGPTAPKKEINEFSDLIKKNPRKYIAQPVMSLSTVPTIRGDHLEGRHVDLRPFVIYGDGIYVLPGGLTRVALKKGSLVVNSSQGGGSKDTWVV